MLRSIWQAMAHGIQNWKQRILICFRHIQSNWKYNVIVNQGKKSASNKFKYRTQTNLYLYGMEKSDTNEIPFV